MCNKKTQLGQKAKGGEWERKEGGMKEGRNFLKRNNGGVRSGCESFLNGCYQRAGLTLEVLGRGRELRWWNKEKGNKERRKDLEGDKRRRKRCSRQMRGSRRKLTLVLGT